MGDPHLTSEEIRDEVAKRLKRYKGLNVLEQYAMFMGVAQVVEIALKQLLNRRYGEDAEALERRSLGQVAGLLRERGLRRDFVQLLEGVVEHRNHIAHSLLASQFMLIELGAEGAGFEVRELEKGIYEIERLWFIFEWTEKNEAWGENAV